MKDEEETASGSTTAELIALVLEYMYGIRNW